jgi:hypothetical protein
VSDTIDNHAAPEATRRLPNGRWPKGTSGNPNRHKAYVERQRQRQAHEKELLADIVARAGRPLSAIDMAFAKLAAIELSKALFTKNPNDGRTAARAAQRMIAELRNGASFRPSPGAALDLYLAGKADADK